MTNSRQKGKRIERYFKNALKEIFPEVSRNYNAQSDAGGRDLLNTGPFCCEVKGGKQYKYKGIRKILDQCHDEADDHEWELSLVKPDRENPYVMLPWADFLEILAAMKAEKML